MLKLRVFLFAFVFSTFTTFMSSRAMEMSREKFVVIGCVASLGLAGGLYASSPVFKAFPQKFFQFFGFGKEKEKIQADFEVAFAKMINEDQEKIELQYWEACKDLLRKGANPNVLSEELIFEWTPLFYACNRNDVEMVQFLLGNQAIDVNFPCRLRLRPLVEACRQGNGEIVELLLKAGADLKSVADHAFLSVLEFLCFAKADERHNVVKLLLQYGANPNVTINQLGDTPLILAESFEDMQVLIEYGADVNYRRSDGMSVLDYLLRRLDAFEKDEDVNKYVSLLVKGGCKINSQGTEGYTALHRVSQNYNIKLTKMSYVVSTLFNHGADPNITDKQGRTAFDCAYSDDVKKILRDSYLHSPAVKDNVLLLFGAKHVNSRGIDESEVRNN